MRSHTHPCSRCQAPIPCGGYRVDNYDGFPPVLCSVEAEMDPDERFLCEDCAIDDVLNEIHERPREKAS